MAEDSLREALKDKVAGLTERPGVYLMKDVGGVVLYVGKAVNLKHRVKSYFQDPARLAPKVAALMRHVADFEVIATDTEVEALILEANLIKARQPRYNIRLKDDKAYPYLRLTWEESYPRLLIARRPQEDGGRYFGPYAHAQTVHDTIRLLRRIFPIRNCTNQKFKNQSRPCLEHFIHRCQAPCQAMVTVEDYRAMMQEVEWFLEGRSDAVIKDLRKKLEAAANQLQFERAAEIRDQIRAVEEVTKEQKVSSQAGSDLDAIHWAIDGDTAFVQVFTVRQGRLSGRDSFTVGGVDPADEGELARAFVLQYYAKADVPQEILLPVEPHELASLKAWLQGLRGGRVSLEVPRRGEKERLLIMVGHNAEISRDEARRRLKTRERDREEGLLGLQHALGLDKAPQRMECYDISNTQGTESVASMVVFEGGRPNKSQYRKFKIRTVEGPNDFASMAEVIARRFRHVDAFEDVPGKARFAERPDLVIIDGGQGQLGYAVRAMREAGFGDIPVFGLAKRNEWLFEPDRSEPIILDRDSAALKLVQQIRDEAHRFAITFHRQLRTKRNLKSLLDDIPGIGPKRKRQLVAHYQRLDALAQASVDELAGLPGMTRKAAESVLAYFSAQAEEGDSKAEPNSQEEVQ
jgi:excinuclease ABC subunit C